MKDRSVLLRRAVVGALALITVPAFGQQATEQPQDTRTIDTIIVTAQKREQSLQDVPIVVTAVSEQLLQDTGVKDIKDLTILTPGLLVTSTSNEVDHYRSYPRYRHGGRQRRPGIVGRCGRSTAFIGLATAWASATSASWSASKC